MGMVYLQNVRMPDVEEMQNHLIETGKKRWLQHGYDITLFEDEVEEILRLTPDELQERYLFGPRHFRTEVVAR